MFVSAHGRVRRKTPSLPSAGHWRKKKRWPETAPASGAPDPCDAIVLYSKIRIGQRTARSRTSWEMAA